MLVFFISAFIVTRTLIFCKHFYSIQKRFLDKMLLLRDLIRDVMTKKQKNNCLVVFFCDQKIIFNLFDSKSKVVGLNK
jgi:hypothetical protein